MKVAVNLLPFRRQLAGAGRYAMNILANLAEIDWVNRYVLFSTEESAPHFQTESRIFSHVVCPFSPTQPLVRILWEQLVLPWQLVQHRVNLLFTPSVAIPFWIPCKAVTAIHDAIPFYPGVAKYRAMRALYIRLMTKRAARRSDLVLTGSESSKRDISRFCGVAQGKIIVIPYGVESKFRPLNEDQAIMACRAKYQLPAEFILFVGTLEPGKNLVRLIKAFRQLIDRNPFIQHQLVLAGGRGWGASDIFAAVDELALVDRVVCTGFVADKDLPLLYNAADLLILPSLYEGFGLPVLEAMACGTPVIASNVSSLPEVVGETGLLVDPRDVDGLASVMERALTDQELRGEMTRKGLDRAKGFPWRRAAELTLETFRNLGDQD